MSKIEGGVPVTGFISPTDSEDTYATHKDIYGQGGYRSVANIEERDAISGERRSEGMLVFVKDTNLTYQLIDGIENTHWVTKSDIGIDELTNNYIIVGNELNEPQASAALIDVREDIAIIYERLDQIQGVGTGGGTQDRGTRDMSGFVVGEVEPDGSMYTTRGPDCVLTVIPAGGDVDLDLNRIVNVADPRPNDGTPAGDFGQYDATNRSYVDKHKWLSESITDLDSTIKGYSLDQFNPPAVNLNLNGKVLGNVATSTNPNDAATVEYVNNALEEIGGNSPITLTGAVTGSGTETIETKLTDITVSQITDFTSSVNSIISNTPLNNLSYPTGSLDMKNQTIINLNNPDPEDGSAVTNVQFVQDYVNNAVDNIDKSVTLTGAVTGSGTGTINTTLTPSAVTSFRLNQFAVPTTSVNMNSQRLIGLAVPTQGTDATNKTYVDSTASNAVSNRTTTLTGAVTGSGTGNTISTTLTPSAVTSFRLNQFAVPTASVNMNSQKITGLATPTLGTDATNKTYVDSTASNAVSNRTTTLTGAVTGSGTGNTINTTLTPSAVTSYRLNQFAVPTASVNMNNRKITSLATPTLGTDATNKAYVDNAILASQNSIIKPFGCLMARNNNQNQLPLANSTTNIGVGAYLSPLSIDFSQEGALLRCDSTTEYIYNISATIQFTCSASTALTFYISKNYGTIVTYGLHITVINGKYIVTIESEPLVLTNTDRILVRVNSTNAITLKVENYTLKAIPI